MTAFFSCVQYLKLMLFMKMYFCNFQMYIYFVMDLSININNIVNYTLK